MNFEVGKTGADYPARFELNQGSKLRRFCCDEKLCLHPPELASYIAPVKKIFPKS